MLAQRMFQAKLNRYMNKQRHQKLAHTPAQDRQHLGPALRCLIVRHADTGYTMLA